MEDLEEHLNIFQTKAQQYIEELQTFYKQTSRDVGLSDSQIPLLVVITTLIIVAITARLLFQKKRAKSIIIVGPSGAGKTALFHQLKHGSTLNGFLPSLEENQGLVQLNSPNGSRKRKVKVDLIDIPGPPKLWYKVENNLKTANGIIYVLDASQFMPTLKEITSQLWNLISNQYVQQRKIPIMICCNKQDDEVNIMSNEFIQKKLEKELESIRSNLVNSKQLQENKSKSLNRLKMMKSFTFKDVPIQVQFAKASARTGDLKDINNFIKQHIK